MVSILKTDDIIDTDIEFDQVFDPSFDISSNMFRIIDYCKWLYDSYAGEYPVPVLRVIEMMLLRLRIEYPQVFAITVGQFSYFEGLEDYWKINGYIDPKGYRWLCRK